MEAVIFAILFLVAVVRALYRFAQWAVQALRRMNAPGGQPAPAQPMAPRTTAAGPEAGRTPPLTDQRPPRPTSPPSTSPSDAATMRNRETPSSLGVPPSTNFPPADTDTANPGEVGPLFGTTSDLVRAIILREALGPPLSQRRRSSH